MLQKNLALLLVALFAITSCVKYKEKPLVPSEVLKEIVKLRENKNNSEQNSLSFEQAAELVSQNSPQLNLVKIKYQASQNLANIKTPWFNPSIDIGPTFGTNLGPGATNKVSPFIGLGFTIPLGGKLKKNDDLNTSKARRAFLEIQSQHRELYLVLRSIFTQMHLLHQKEVNQKELVLLSEITVKTMTASLNAGAANALEVGMVEMDLNKIETELIDIKLENETVKAKLATMLGVDLSTSNITVNQPLLKADKALPTEDDLRNILINNNLDLARLKFDYDIAEKTLRLEISKQYPDLHFGSENEKEVGADSILLGLRIGISVPIFDRNQQGIAEAQMHREKIRSEYQLVLHKTLSELNSNLDKITLYTEKNNRLKNQLQPKVKENLKLAESAMKTGGLGIIKYLDVQRNYNEMMKSIIQSEADLQLAWVELESLLCFPIISAPGDDIFLNNLYETNTEENKNEK